MPILHPNQLFAERFRLQRPLGSGGFSEVWLAYNEVAGLDQVVKIYNGVDDNGINIFRQEFTRVYNLSHPSLLRSSTFDVYKGLPYLVMPYCKRGSAVSLIGQVSEKDLARVLYDIGSALAYIHDPAHRIIHKDIKPDNILIANNGEYLLTDFGISGELRQELKDYATRKNIITSSDAGITPMAYRAPEYFNRAYEGSSLIASDIWSFGSTLYELATGKMPFGEMGGSMQQKDTPIPDLPRPFSKELSKIVKQCLAYEPWDRPTGRDLYKAGKSYLGTGQWPSKTKTPIYVQPNPSSVKPSVKKGNKNRELSILLTLAGVFIFAILAAFGMVQFGVFDEWFSDSSSEQRIEEPVVKVDPPKEEIEIPLKEDTPNVSNDDASNNKILGKETEESSVEELTPKEVPPVRPKQAAPTPRYTYEKGKIYVEDEPDVSPNSPCRADLLKVYLGQNETTLTMSLKNCGFIDIYPPDQRDGAFFIKDKSSKVYRLKRATGIRLGEKVDAGSYIKFDLHFQPLPRSTRAFDLIEGNRPFAEDRSYWHFKGIELND